MVCEAASVCLTPCRAKPVASKEAAIRGHIGADVVFGDQKHKLAFLKNVSIILDHAPILGLWFPRFPALLASEEIRRHDCGIASVHGAIGSARLTHGSDG